MTEIFEATAFDLEHLADLFNQYRVFYKQATDLPAARGFIKERMMKKDAVIYIASEEDKLLGFVQLFPLFSSVQMKPLWLLNDLYVESSHRRKGVARQLIAAAKQHSKVSGAGGLMLETGRANHEGNALYPSEGFQLIENNFYYFNVL
jgi:GNAT superfamily N-acetyltransferase